MLECRLWSPSVIKYLWWQTINKSCTLQGIWVSCLSVREASEDSNCINLIFWSGQSLCSFTAHCDIVSQQIKYPTKDTYGMAAQPWTTLQTHRKYSSLKHKVMWANINIMGQILPLLMSSHKPQQDYVSKAQNLVLYIKLPRISNPIAHWCIHIEEHLY